MGPVGPIPYRRMREKSMNKSFDDVVTRTIGNDVQIPSVGFGTFQIWPYQAQEAVEQALELGYRHVDTAQAYCNEAQVGAALAATGKANSTFVTTKIRNGDQGYDSTLRSFDESLAALGVDTVDLLLIHWPCPTKDLFVDTWRAFVHLREEGAVRAIGVSNFMVEHLAKIISETGVAPDVNQIESHPRYWQPELEAYCADHGIVVEAYSPLGHGGDISSEPVETATVAHGVTAAQVVLRWHLQKGHVILPKSTHVERMRQNVDLGGFELTEAELAAIDALNDPSATVSLDPYSFCGPQTLEDLLSRGAMHLEP